jgi:Tat protein secretion system quality control protein TatD with DNase activity
MMDCLIAMKSGIGSRFYFSFSPVINMRSPKTVEVIKKVPQVPLPRFRFRSFLFISLS